MARYFFCNATTTKNLPCQIPVANRGDRCHFHGGGDNGGPTPGQVFKVLKIGLDAIIYTQAAFEATEFVCQLASKVLSLIGGLVGVSARSPEQLVQTIDTRRTDVILAIKQLPEHELQQLMAQLNCIIALAADDRQESSQIHAAGA